MTAPDSAIWVAAPATTVKVSVFEFVGPAVRVALARRVTDPPRTPVTVTWATPPTAVTEVRPLTEPVPAV